MAIQSSINSMLGTVAGAMTAKSIVGKAVLTTDANVGNDANSRAKKIQSQKKQRKTKRMEVNK